MTNFQKHRNTSFSFKVLDPEMSPRFSAKIQSILTQQLPQNMRAEAQRIIIGNVLSPEEPVQQVKRLTNIGMMGYNMLSEEDIATLIKD